jgi:hypothetical protein
MSGMSCIIWVYVTPNVRIMEISLLFLVKPGPSVKGMMLAKPSGLGACI